MLKNGLSFYNGLICLRDLLFELFLLFGGQILLIFLRGKKRFFGLLIKTFLGLQNTDLYPVLRGFM